MKLLPVIVIYNTALDKCATFSTLSASLRRSKADGLEILVYDNSPFPQTPVQAGTKLHYVHDPTNSGLAAAYNRALVMAVSQGYEWILPLDQDSVLPEDFISRLLETASGLVPDATIAAIVPRVSWQGRLISPSVIKFGGYLRPVPPALHGKSATPVTSINSGTLLRTSFLQEIGGFNTLFWLDFLDHWLFNRIYKAGKCVFMSDITIEHELSVMDYDKWVSPARYENILLAEELFIRICRPGYEKYIYMIRLLKRLVMQRIKSPDPKLAALTQAAIFRLFRKSSKTQEPTVAVPYVNK